MNMKLIIDITNVTMSKNTITNSTKVEHSNSPGRKGHHEADREYGLVFCSQWYD